MSPCNPRLSAGVVVVRPSEEGWRFLLLRAFTHWDFPKGMVEPGEQPLEAAIRAQHPYETPEIIALPVTCGLPDYLAWVAAETLPT